MELENSIFIEEKQLANLLENIQEGLWVYDRTLRSYIYFSNTIASIYGRKNSDFARNLNLWAEAVYPEDAKVFEKASIGLLKHGIVESKYRISLPDGKIRWIKDKRKLLRDYSHFPRWVVGVITDITDSVLSKEELAESDVSFQILFHENTTPMCIYEKQKGKILEVNSSLIYILGYRYDEFLEKKITDLLCPDDVSGFLENQNLEINQKDRKEYEKKIFRFIAHNSAIKYFVCLHFQSIFHGLESVITLFFDKTESYLYEEKIKKLNKNLEEQNEQWKKIAFLNAHQVRGHLTSLLSLVHLINENQTYSQELFFDLQRTALNLDNSIKKLTETINKDLLEEFSNLSLHESISIMQIDDDPIQLKITELLIKKISEKIIFLPYSDPSLALEDLIKREKRPDLIFLDLNMPVLDGWGLLDELQKNKIQVEVCIISSTNNPEDITRAKNYKNIQGFLIKPITLEKIKNFLPIKSNKEVS